MFVNHLSLTNFRNYGRLELQLPPGPTLLHGNNAQGKTNLLEALYYLATSRSPFADNDHQLLNWDASQSGELITVGRLVCQISTESGRRTVEMRLIQEQKQSLSNGGLSFRREVLVNQRKVRVMDLLGNLRVVLFLPEDVQLITGSPSSRRRYMDITLCQIDNIYCRTLSQYNKVVEQRNALLRQIAEGQSSVDLLPVFTDKVIKLGSQIFARRARFLAEIARTAQQIHYESLTEGKETIRLRYLPRLVMTENGRSPDDHALTQAGEWLQTHSQNIATIEARFEETLSHAQHKDIARGSTSVGPHRDDWHFVLNGRSLSSFGSRGQQRSAILALKLAEIQWMTAQTGESPVLLLDEVVAELDAHRRALLLNTVLQATQSILTATDPAMFTSDFLHKATSMTVQNGRVQLDPVFE
ncbi:MAG: DNA replication/repair protein RecF [Candidatus Promineifilaceae bacterium]